MKKISAFLLVCVIVSCAHAQNMKVWNSKKCAIVLTYDDALDVHLDNAIPLLDSLNMRATFFVPGNAEALNRRMDEWREAANSGHELGNHTLFHPCDGRPAGRDFVTPENDLSTYTQDRIVNEILMANTFLKAIDGKNKRSFAYTCGDTKVGDSLFFDRLRKDLTGARGVRAGMSTIENVNVDNIDSYMISGHTAEYMIKLVDQAVKTGSLLVFLFHGVGGGHNINVDLNEHNKLLRYISTNEKDIWVTTFSGAVEYIKEYREK